MKTYSFLGYVELTVVKEKPETYMNNWRISLTVWLLLLYALYVGDYSFLCYAGLLSKRICFNLNLSIFLSRDYLTKMEDQINTRRKTMVFIKAKSIKKIKNKKIMVIYLKSGVILGFMTIGLLVMPSFGLYISLNFSRLSLISFVLWSNFVCWLLVFIRCVMVFKLVICMFWSDIRFQTWCALFCYVFCFFFSF